MKDITDNHASLFASICKLLRTEILVLAVCHTKQSVIIGYKKQPTDEGSRSKLVIYFWECPADAKWAGHSRGQNPHHSFAAPASHDSPASVSRQFFPPNSTTTHDA
ncbi:predicted protein [Coccidioides posadasii str. Silveira]|uniref:Predicted protein n=2 Tax=Coccidioides posadasii TaxID=199306 RepID=E9D289_COCPS|nr:predicted protein [Coccidioides posadasii str. Silveira]KMM71762.1 hypothetical protein CPAG_08063 [Coccidioides posadasii RMSCC 3488]